MGVEKLHRSMKQIIWKSPFMENCSCETQLVHCTNCKFCMPCSSGVDIPENIRILNEYYNTRDLNQATKAYLELNQEKVLTDSISASAAACITCGHCIFFCPQSIKIPSILQKLNEIIRQKSKITDLFYPQYARAENTNLEPKQQKGLNKESLRVLRR